MNKRNLAVVAAGIMVLAMGAIAGCGDKPADTAAAPDAASPAASGAPASGAPASGAPASGAPGPANASPAAPK